MIGGFTLVFGWLYARPLVEDGYLAGTDLFDYYLPIFFSPITVWSTFELSGMPALADLQNAPFYPVNLLFARLVPSWSAYIVSAYVLAAALTYAYVHHHTRSKAAGAIAGLAYGMSEAMMERVDHISIVHVTVWLPLIALAVDKVREAANPATASTRAAARWVAAGAFAVACCLLAGHSQVTIYIVYVAGLYALAGGLAGRARLRYYVAVFLLFGAGALLAAVSALPLWDARPHMVRQTVGFAQFVSHSNTPAQMLSFLFPAVLHEVRDGATYVGVATVVFAVLGLLQARRHWFVGFWLVVAVLALATGAGDSTPVAAWLYEMPLYSSFRVVARHLFLAAFAFSVLAGIGAGAVAHSRVSKRAVWLSAAAVLAAFAAGALLIAARPASFPIDDRAWPVLGGTTLPPAVAGQLAIAVATAIACAAFAGVRARRVSVAVLLAMLAVDLAHALPYRFRPYGLEVPIVPARALRPSIHAAQLGRGLAPEHQRMLYPDGVTVDPVVPGAFARLWRIPVAGGYGAIMTTQYATLASMGTTGEVDVQVLSHDSAALDLLAVKYVLMPRRTAAPATVDAQGTTWLAEPIDVPVGPPECGQPHPREATFVLPADVELSRLSILAALRCSEDVPQGTVAATLRVVGEGGGSYELPLRAGVEIAEAGLASADLRRRARHQPPASALPADEGLFDYLLHVDLPRPLRGARIEMRVGGTAGWVQLRKVTATDPAGVHRPLSATDLLIGEGARWHRTGVIRTSPTTDRGIDETSADEQEIAVFENRRARPRAWMAADVIPLGARDMLMAIQYGHLPDGRRFDPATMALVESGGPAAATYAGGTSDVRIESIEDGRIRLDVNSQDGGFLVLSESFYPGWRARIDDTVAPVHRTNVSLQGVAVPAGRHTVTFEFAPASFRLGGAISAVTLILLLALAAWGAAGRRPVVHAAPVAAVR